MEKKDHLTNADVEILVLPRVKMIGDFGSLCKSRSEVGAIWRME